VTKNDVQNVYRQPAHKLTNDDATVLLSSVNGIFTDVTMMSSLVTAFPSKQEKYLITHLHAWSIAMEHAKNYEIRCKIF